MKWTLTTSVKEKKKGKNPKVCEVRVQDNSSFLFIYVSLHISESRFKEKHSLDSDEEDTVDEVQLAGLDDEDLAAQEESTVVSGQMQVLVRL